MTPSPTLGELIDLIQRDSDSDEPLDRLATASGTITELAATGDAVLGHFVDQARAAGHTWTEISSVLGVTKQAVHKRFTPLRGPFTDRARLTVSAAEAAARALGHSYVGTEHLLLGIFAVPEGLAAIILAEHGLDREQVEAATLEVTPRAQTNTEPTVPYTPKAKRVLEDCHSQAGDLGHGYIGTEHLLLALAACEGVAASVLTDSGLDRDRARAAVVKKLTELR